MAKMTKAQSIDALAKNSGLSKKAVDTVLTELTKLTYSEIKKAGEFTLPGLGKFVKVRQKARMGYNPSAGKKIQIPAKTTVKFRVSKSAKDVV